MNCLCSSLVPVPQFSWPSGKNCAARVCKPEGSEPGRTRGRVLGLNLGLSFVWQSQVPSAKRASRLGLGFAS